MRAIDLTESISRFDSHQIIGIDFDGTLVGHPKSPRIWAYIEEHQDKQYYIITMRNTTPEHGRNYYAMIWDDLDLASDGRITQDHFVAAISTSEAGDLIDFDFIRGVYKMTNLKKRQRILDMKGIDEEWLARRYDEITSMKALACKKVGATILIDDWTESVLPGCEKHGIEYMHPDEL